MEDTRVCLHSNGQKVLKGILKTQQIKNYECKGKKSLRVQESTEIQTQERIWLWVCVGTLHPF